MKILTEPNGMRCLYQNGDVFLHDVPRTMSGHVDVPANVTVITNHSFDRCHQITSITIPASVRQIEPKAFHGCNRLEEIRVDPRNTVYADSDGVLFSKDKQKLIRAPIRQSGFYVVPAGTKRLEDGAFRDCRGITTLLLPDELIHVGAEAFRGCNGLFRMTIPKHVTYVGTKAFYECAMLSSIAVDVDNKQYVADGKGVLFNKALTRLICAPATISGTYIVPDGVTHIEAHAFAKCKRLSAVTLPASLTKIGNSAFMECGKLATVTFAEGLEVIGSRAFMWCDALQTVHLPDSLTAIGINGFAHDGHLTSVTLGEHLRQLAPSAFTDCPQLSWLAVPAANPHYANDAAGALLDKAQKHLLWVPCNLKERYVCPDRVVRVAEGVFQYCTDVHKVYVSIDAPDSIWRNIDPYPHITETYWRDVDGIIYCRETLTITTVWKEIVCADIVNGITHIPSRAFADRMKLTAVYIPPSVRNIDVDAFAGSYNLKKIVVHPDNPYLFNDECGALYSRLNKNVVLLWVPPMQGDSYTVRDGTTHITDYAFACHGLLREVILPNSVWAISPSALVACPHVTLRGEKGSGIEQHAALLGVPFEVL